MRLYQYFNDLNKKNIIYIIGISSIYFFCELLKKIFYNNTDNLHYNNCIKLLSNNIRMTDVYKICENLNNISTYQKCFHNLFLSIVIISSLININKLTNYKYWLVSHLSAYIYTYMGKFKIFQFSIDTNTNYNFSKIIILSILGIILLIGITLNLVYKKIKYKYIINYICCYSTLFLLHRCISNNIIYHFHHSLVCIFLSYFFSDWSIEDNRWSIEDNRWSIEDNRWSIEDNLWSSTINYYIHSILLGIIIQGLNFFYLNEFSMFYISNQLFPQVFELLKIYIVFLILLVLVFSIPYYLYKNQSVGDNEEIENDFEIPLLVPNLN